MRNRSYLLSALPVMLVLGIVAWCMQATNQALAHPPGEDDVVVEIAQGTTDSLINALLAAVVDITGRTTPEATLPNSQAISLLLPESQNGYRLLDGTGDPIDRRNRPHGRFEREALERALNGETTCPAVILSYFVTVRHTRNPPSM